MTALSISAPFPTFNDTDGEPLENGYIYIGTANQNPVTSPIAVYWDAALTIPAVQPIRTSGGYPVYNGTPANIYANSDYSIRVTNKNGTLVYSAAAETSRYDSALVGYTPSGTGAVATTVQSKLRESVSVKDFGADPLASAAVNTAAIQAALNSGAKTVWLPAGTYTVSSQITVPATVSMVGSGKDNTIITAEGNTTGSFTDGAVVYKGGVEPTALPDLSVDVARSATSLTFASAHGLVAGDVILIYNPTDGSFNSARTYYRAGEYCTVSSVTDSVTVVLENGLYAAYLAADVDVYKCAGYCSGRLEGFTAIAPGPGANGIVRAVAVEYGHKIEVHDVGARNSDNASMSIGRTYKLNASSLECHQWGAAPGFGTQYGLSIGNCQEADISGSFIGERHGIAYGGGDNYAIPNRSCNVHDFFAKNNSGAIASADWHGNCEWCVYENGQIFGGGLNIAGNNNRISGIMAQGDNMMLILGREILGCDHVVENIKCYTGRNDNTRGIINIGGNETPMDNTITRFGGQFVFRNIEINAPNNTRQCIVIRNRGFLGDPFDVICQNITYIAPNSNSTSFAVVSVNSVSGDPCARVQATNIVTLSSVVTPPLILGSLELSGGCLVRQDSLSGLASVETTTAVALVDTSVSFARNFTKTPHVALVATSQTTSGDRCAGYAISQTNSGFTARYARVDATGSNFTADATRTMSWVASLMEW